ncbi:MAG: hypothetical protein ACXAC2_00215 [Candidatus Kariarchaeaceae archaeon]
MLLGKSFVGWDWDDTCAFRGTDRLLPRVGHLMDQLATQYHLGNVVITNRTQSLSVVTPFIHHVIWRKTKEEAETNPYRWKMGKLRELWRRGTGPLLLYIDNDYEFVKAVRKQGDNFPIVTCEKYQLEKIVSWIGYFKTKRLKALSVVE